MHLINKVTLSFSKDWQLRSVRCLSPWTVIFWNSYSLWCTSLTCSTSWLLTSLYFLKFKLCNHIKSLISYELVVAKNSGRTKQSSVMDLQIDGASLSWFKKSWLLKAPYVLGEPDFNLFWFMALRVRRRNPAHPWMNCPYPPPVVLHHVGVLESGSHRKRVTWYFHSTPSVWYSTIGDNW